LQNEVFSPQNGDCGTNANWLWEVETSIFGCVFTTGWPRDILNIPDSLRENYQKVYFLAKKKNNGD